MATIAELGSGETELPHLQNGDHMKQSEFHYAYLQMPENYRAELIGGMVFEPSPVGYLHAANHSDLGFLLHTYVLATGGTEIADNATVILGDDDEVQPDLLLRISQDCGGQSRINEKGYLGGAPELVAELASSSRSVDLHLKKQRYALAGVREYFVLSLRPRKFFCFDLCGGSVLPECNDGIVRSVVFPGLWLKREAIASGDYSQALETLNQGLASKGHREFVLELEGKRRG